MAEINDGKGIKTIAYYLPQFHSIPENDQAWGEGFTEWTNTKKAKPLFEGHNQPKTPLNENYYNLLDDKTKIWQSELAQKYGVFGFCYYHYWFKNGKKLLEKPAEQMLANKEITIPFCFSWANENWTRLWDGGNKELIAEQDYGEEEEWIDHFKYLLPFFRDNRYITLNDEPIFLIYKPEEIPKVKEMISCWKNEAIKAGLKGICFMIQNPNWYFQPSYNQGGFSYQIKFHPFFAIAYKNKNMKLLRTTHRIYRCIRFLHLQKIIDSCWKGIRKQRHKGDSNQQRRLDYDDVWSTIIESESRPELIEGAFVDWDNTARKKNGIMHLNASPEKFKKYMSLLFDKINKNEQQSIVFLNAWNEWCEGAYLEPDTFHRYDYLEALQEAIALRGRNENIKD